MEELAGHCKVCGKPVMCQGGFLQGIVLEDQSIVCFDCDEAANKKPRA